MVAIMHIKLTDNAPGRMLDLFDIGIDGHRTLGDDGSDKLAGRSPAAEPKNQYRHQRTAPANVLADAVVGPEPRQCILQPSLAHRTAAGWLTPFKGREAGLVCGVTAGLVCAVKQARFCSFGQNCCWIRNVCRDPTRFGSSYSRPPTTKQASNSSTDQGGGKRRAAVILTQIKVRTSRDFLLLNLSAALKCEATDEICPACAQRYRRNSLVPHTGQSSKLSVVRGVRRDSQWSDELRLCNLSAVSGHYQRNWRVLRPK